MNTKHYTNLLAQAEKLYRHNRQGSYKTKERYFEAYKRFLRYVAVEYRLEKISNISGKHLSSYINHMQEGGKAASTIKTDLAAIRFWHDKIPDAKFVLPENNEFELERRKFGAIDRTWSESEIEQMIAECRRGGRVDFASCIIIARNVGLRLHEVMRIDTAIARAAIKSGNITIKGKGGLVRAVPLNEIAIAEIEKALAHTESGYKLFVPRDEQSHVTKQKLQEFIAYHRKRIKNSGEATPITFHGLRHTYAAEAYKRLLSEGCSEHEAMQQVSLWLGHKRPEVTRIYLASVKGGGG